MKYSRDLKPLIKFVEMVMESNVRFLDERKINLLGTYNEFIYDFEDLMNCLEPTGLSKEEEIRVYDSHLIYPMIFHVVYPNVYLIPVLVLVGALPHTFFSMRSIIEALAIGLYTDNYEEIRSLSLSEKIERLKNIRFSHLRDELPGIFCKVFIIDIAFELKELIYQLYQHLSSWIHPIAKVRGKDNSYVVGQLRYSLFKISENSLLASFGLNLPTEYYSETDELYLRYLKDILLSFQLAIKAMIAAWSYGKDFINYKCIIESFDKAYRKYERQSKALGCS